MGERASPLHPPPRLKTPNPSRQKNIMRYNTLYQPQMPSP